MPFGETRYTSGDTPTQRRFTGQIEDSSTGLYFYNARYYDPTLGRFIQPDAIIPELGNPQSLNRYSYVYNNPLRYTDPTGFFTEEAIAGYYGVRRVEDISWWDDPDYADFQQMLLEAEAGDVLFATDDDNHQYFFTFAGKGRERLDGVYHSDGNGNPRRCYRCGYDNDITLNNLVKGSFPYTMGGRTRPKDIQWYGFIRWIDQQPQIYVPEGYTFAGGEYTGVQRTGVKLAVATIFAYSPLPPGGKVLGAYGSSEAWIEAHHMAPGDVHVYVYRKTKWGYLEHYNYSFHLRFSKTNTGWIAE